MGSFLNEHLCEVRRGLDKLKQKSNMNFCLILLLVAVIATVAVVGVVMYVKHRQDEFDFDSFLDDDDFDDEFDALAATDEDFET